MKKFKDIAYVGFGTGLEFDRGELFPAETVVLSRSSVKFRWPYKVVSSEVAVMFKLKSKDRSLRGKVKDVDSSGTGYVVECEFTTAAV